METLATSLSCSHVLTWPGLTSTLFGRLGGMYTLERVHLSFTNETLKLRKGIHGARKGQTYATTLPRMFISLGCRAGLERVERMFQARPVVSWGVTESPMFEVFSQTSLFVYGLYLRLLKQNVSQAPLKKTDP